MKRITIRPLVSLPEDKIASMRAVAADTGISFNQFVAMCVTMGFRTFERTMETGVMFTPGEVGEFFKALGLDADITKGIVSEIERQEKQDAEGGTIKEQLARMKK